MNTINTINIMAESLIKDMGYIGMLVADERVQPDYISFEVGNNSITFAKVIVTQRGVTVKAYGRLGKTLTHKPIKYKDSLEKLSEDVCSKVIKAAFKGKPS